MMLCYSNHLWVSQQSGPYDINSTLGVLAINMFSHIFIFIIFILNFEFFQATNLSNLCSYKYVQREAINETSDMSRFFIKADSGIVIECQRNLTRGKSIRGVDVVIRFFNKEDSVQDSDNKTLFPCQENKKRIQNVVSDDLMKLLSVEVASREINISCNFDLSIKVIQDNFVLQAKIFITDVSIVNSTLDLTIEAVMNLDYSDTACEFDTSCILQNSSDYKTIQVQEKNCSECKHLPKEWNPITGTIWFFKNVSNLRIRTNTITGTTYDSILQISIWKKYFDSVQLVVAAVFNNECRVIEEFTFEDTTNVWRNETLQIGRINKAFYFLILLNSFEPMAIDTLKLIMPDHEFNDSNFKGKCNGSEFLCQSGQCIDINKTCDMIQNCFDGDDEEKSAGCIENNSVTSCNFEKSTCGWTNIFNNSSCSWKVQNSNQIRLKQNLFILEQRGNILYLNGSNCVYPTASTLTSPWFEQMGGAKNECKITFAYVMYNMKLEVLINTDSGPKKIRHYMKEFEWRTESLLIPYQGKRMQIKFRGLTIKNTTHNKYIGLDAIHIDKTCFITGNVMTEVPNSVSSIAIVSVVFVCTILCCIIVIVVRRRRAGKKFTLKLHKYHSDHMLYEQNSSYSPVYSHTDDISFDDYIKSIPRQRITIKSLIAKGNFGEVYYGLLSDVAHQKQDVPVAIKTLPRLCSEQTRSDFFVEGVTLSKLKHQNIVRLLGISLEASSIYLVCELMNGGDLRTHVRHLRGDIDETAVKNLINFVIDVANGCQYLEENGCIHRDLAARNCLLSQESDNLMVVKVGDFGLSRFIGRTNYYRKTGSAPIPVKWMSPEAFIEGMFTSKTDVWSFGILLWEVYSLGCVPYPGKSHEEVMEFVKNGGIPTKPDLCSDEIYEVMLRCWNLSPPDRPDFLTLKTQLLHIRESGGQSNIMQQCSIEQTN